MHPRHTAPLLIGALLLAVTGCVAVPSSPPAGPPRPPAGLAPADDRPPSPLPSPWPDPTQAPPRETLASTGPAPADAKAPATGRQARGTSPAPAPRTPARHGPAAHHHGTGHPVPPKRTPSPKSRTKKKPTPPKATPRPRPASTAGDLRQLCRDAQHVQLPNGVQGLCRHANRR
ncbi:hypothetical protein AB0A60_35675 [Streptomyces sp. NPDC046275]|uniref:hypothetical protein n=1 Tax=Streptomyces sp. NPDC046275 TaxID=3157201 RepID=UPI0033E2D643